jgi:putative transposase
MWRAGCGESRTSGSEGGPEKLTSREAGGALRSDPYTKLLGPQKWTYYYLYILLDIFSRYAVGWMVANRENSTLAGRLIEETCTKQGVEPKVLTLHSDRGSPMTSKCTAQLLADLGVTRSLSRPQVSDDNPFSEAQFKTLKYHPGFPRRFLSIDHATDYCRSFIPWYNTEHRHGGISMLTPDDVHHGRAEPVNVDETAHCAIY